MADNANLTEKLSSMERANGRLIQQLDGVSLVSGFRRPRSSNDCNIDQWNPSELLLLCSTRSLELYCVPLQTMSGACGIM